MLMQGSLVSSHAVFRRIEIKEDERVVARPQSVETVCLTGVG